MLLTEGPLQVSSNRETHQSLKLEVLSGAVPENVGTKHLHF